MEQERYNMMSGSRENIPDENFNENTAGPLCFGRTNELIIQKVVEIDRTACNFVHAIQQNSVQNFPTCAVSLTGPIPVYFAKTPTKADPPIRWLTSAKFTHRHLI